MLCISIVLWEFLTTIGFYTHYCSSPRQAETHVRVALSCDWHWHVAAGKIEEKYVVDGDLWQPGELVPFV